MTKFEYTRKQLATDIRLLTSNIGQLDENGIIKSLCLLELDLLATKPKVKSNNDADEGGRKECKHDWMQIEEDLLICRKCCERKLIPFPTPSKSKKPKIEPIVIPDNEYRAWTMVQEKFNQIIDFLNSL